MTEQAKTPKSYDLADLIENAIDESSAAQDLLRLAWLCCMNLADGSTYRFDPSQDEKMRNYCGLESIKTAIHDCVGKLQSLDEKLDIVTNELLKELRADDTGRF